MPLLSLARALLSFAAEVGMPRTGIFSLTLAFVTVGCTDYGFSKGAKERPTGSHHGTDTGEFVADTGGGIDSGPPPGDTGTPPEDTEEPPDTSTPDECYEPEDGYGANAAARLISTDGSTTIRVTLVASDTAYQDELWLDHPDSTMLARAWSDPMGTSKTLGPYAPKTELAFGIDIMDTGEHWQSGPGNRNSDGVVHGAVTYEGNCSWLMGFEDLTGGGDRDYNDVVLRVEGQLRQDQ